MRLFRVSEELLPIDSHALRPAPLKAEMSLRYRPGMYGSGAGDLSVDLSTDRLLVSGPMQSSMLEQLETIRIGRTLADRAAKAQGRRAVALASPVLPYAPMEPSSRRRREAMQGTEPDDSHMCGFTVHVAVTSPEEGVQVLDRIRVWMPVLLALSANSPFWSGRPSRMNSHRYFLRSKWPAPGPNAVFGSTEEYERQAAIVAHPPGRRLTSDIHVDARLSTTRDSVEVLLTDVCLNAEHAAAVAALTRALVEVAVGEWRSGTPPPSTSVAELRAASWLAAMNGVEGKLLSPMIARTRFSQDVVAELLEVVRPVLQEGGEAEYVADVMDDIWTHGTGCRRQRDAYAIRQDPHDVVAAAMYATHDPSHAHGVPGGILAEAWTLAESGKAASG